jgi:hypothetical protein
VPSRYTVVRARWWLIHRPWNAVYRHLRRQPAAGLVTDGSTTSSAGPELGDDSRSVNYRPSRIPRSINSATLTLEVVPLTHHTSAIAAFAVVVRQPVRPRAEVVPISVRSVTLTQRTYSRHGRPRSRHVTVTGGAAASLVHDFNQLVVEPFSDARFSCPAQLKVTSATFRSGSNVWRARDVSCGGLFVTLNHHKLPNLQDAQAYQNDISGAFEVS